VDEKPQIIYTSVVGGNRSSAKYQLCRSFFCVPEISGHTDGEKDLSFSVRIGNVNAQPLY
jgi:hypothetical protein